MVVSVGLALVAPVSSRAQSARPPRACTNTSPATLVTTARGTAVSAVMTGTPATLWVLYGDRTSTGHDMVSLLEVTGLASGNLTLNLHQVGEGQAVQGALAVMGGDVVAAYLRSDGRVGVFLHPLAGGTDRSATLEAPQRPTALAVAAVGSRALVGWDDGGNGLRLAWIDGNGALVGAVRAVAGRYAAPAATPAFGGALLAPSLSDGTARLAVLRATGPARVASVPTPVGALSATAVGRAALALYTDGTRAHLSVLHGPGGAGRDRVLGPAVGASETALGATPWGVLAAWTDGGVVRIAPVGANGVPAGGAFAVSSDAGGERAHAPAVAAAGTSAVVLWSATGAPTRSGTAVRLVRVSCL
jgi:hypothetical protein